MEATIRQATARDYGALCELFEEVDTLHFDHLPNIFQKAHGPAREWDYYSGLLADESVALFVPEVSRELVGFVHAAVRETSPIPLFVPRRHAVVDTLVVKSEHRSCGIGRALMQRVHKWALAKGATSVELTVYEFNQGAIAFYQRLGYEPLSRRLSRPLRGG